VHCDLGRVTFSFEIVGEGRPILMLHGWPLDRTEMIFEMERHFADRAGWKRVYLDLPGMGETPGPEWITCEDQVLDLLEEFVDSVIGSDHFAVAGTSYGGYLALGLVHRRAAQIAGVLMCVPGLLQDENLPVFVKIHQNRDVMEAARSEGMKWLEDMAVSQNDSLLEYARVLHAITPADETYLQRLFTKRWFSFDASALPEPFPAPALLLTGRQDSACGYAGAWGLLEQFPRATFAVLDGAGHLMWGEQPAVCSALVSEWLDRVELWS
jgi:pimeloyl-ACP methyl ester carboxylesterase